jgi:hypothetical protein
MVETGCGGGYGGCDTSHAFSPPMQIIHCTSETRKAHGKDMVVVVLLLHYLPNNSLSSAGDITTITTRVEPLMVKTGGGGRDRETSHAFSPPMQIIHCTSEKRKAHGKGWWWWWWW